jgi:hypothetical protein
MTKAMTKALAKALARALAKALPDARGHCWVWSPGKPEPSKARVSLCVSRPSSLPPYFPLHSFENTLLRLPQPLSDRFAVSLSLQYINVSMAAIPPCNGFPGLEFVQYDGNTYAYVRQIWEAVYSDKSLVNQIMRPKYFIDYYNKYSYMYPTCPGATIHCSATKLRGKQGSVPLGDYGMRPRAIFAFLCSLLIKHVPITMGKLCPLVSSLFGILFAKLTGDFIIIKAKHNKNILQKHEQTQVGGNQATLNEVIWQYR